LLIPVTVVTAWSIFNYLDYGGIHVATRSLSGSVSGWMKSLAIWIITLGAITPFGLIAVVESRPELARYGPPIYASVAMLFSALVYSVATGWVTDDQADKLLQLSFAANGLVMLLWTAPALIRLSQNGLFRIEAAREEAPFLYLMIWLAGTSAFYILFAPFIAARHLLLILPAVMLLLGAHWGGRLAGTSKVFGLSSTIVVSAGLCLSDWHFADFYKSEAITLPNSFSKTGTLWAAGHWGWQWYAAENGIRQIDVQALLLQPKDIIIVAREVDRQTIRTSPLMVQLIRTDTEPAFFADVFCTGRSARFYASGKYGPWSLSRSCRNHIDVYRVSD
jgi:hypothetical protein